METRRFFHGLVFCLILLLAMVNNGAADTAVGGIIASDTTWTVEGSPYIVTGNVLVMSGVTLTIEPGVMVKFESGKAIQIDGTLIARGTSNSKITFTSNKSSPAAGDWGFIYFTNSSTDATYDANGNYTGGSILEYCIVEYAGGLGGDSNGALRLNNAHTFINYCTIRNNSASGIYAWDLPGNLKITNSTINNNTGRGIRVSETFGQLPPYGGIIIISNNCISDNSADYDGGGIYLYSSSTVTITNNIISFNSGGYLSSGGGIFYTGYSPLVIISNNIIIYNKQGGFGGGIYSHSSSNATISNNIICYNSSGGNGGGIMSAYLSSTLTVSKNTICNNSASVGGGIQSSSPTLNLLNNTLTNNTTTTSNSGSIHYIYADFSTVTINLNNIFGNIATHDLFNGDSDNLNAENNWWGTTTESEIQEKIYDWYDDITKGFVDYFPFDTAIRTDAPISPPTGLNATAGINSITLNWSANTESDTAGYKVYWDTYSGHPYANMVDVGNVTSYTLPGLAPGTYYVTVTAYDIDYDPANDDPDTIVNENQTNGNESWYATEYSVTITAPETVSTPSTPSGPTSGATNNPYSYSTGGSVSSLGHSVQYFFDWGDGTNSGWLPVGTTSASHSWTSVGTYTIKTQARCAIDTSVVSSWSETLSVTITISAPETVSTPITPTGPTSGTIGTPYSYTTGGSTSSYGHPVEYQFDWKGDGSDLSSWGATTQSKIWTTAGTYNVRAKARCTLDTSITSDWSGSIEVVIASSRSTRTLPRDYTPSLPLTVTIGINPGAATQAYSAEDSPPNGWTVSNINENGQWDDVNKKVKWGVFFDNNPRILTYQVTPPGGETGVKSFSGKASFDGVNEVTGGDSRIELGALLHPADTGLNFELSINEVTAYAAAWRSGQTWPVPPNPIPIEYPTNAGYVWRNGEAYHYDGTKIPPSCWVPGAAAGSLSVNRSLSLKNQGFVKSYVVLSTGTATRDLPNCYTPSLAMSVSIIVTPAQGTQAYAVEDSPPVGWTVSDINESGGWDNVKNKVKWGLFFDSNNRTLTYNATPPVGETGRKTFSGTVSFDGNNVSIGGDQTIGYSKNPLNDTTEFVKQQYRDFLNREADTGGLQYWVNMIDSGAMTKAQIIDSFFWSEEFGARIAPLVRLYFAYFLRIPDYEGLLYWIDQFSNGQSLESISSAFASSPEFQQTYGSLNNEQFVTLVYQNVLGRSPDPGGYAFWVGELNSGRRTRGQVMLEFSESAEYEANSSNEVFVTMMYVGMLRRSPEEEGFSFWVNYLDSGNSGLGLIDGFLNSTEYANRFQ